MITSGSLKFSEKCFSQVLQKLGYTKKLTSAQVEMFEGAFEKTGGSWVKLAQGGIDEWSLLRDIAIIFVRKHEQEHGRPPSGAPGHPASAGKTGDPT